MVMFPIRTASLIEIMEWAAEYHNYGHKPVSLEMRFGIGIYQIGQAMHWGSSAAGDESKAAACIHFMGVTQKMGIAIETKIPIGLNMFQYSPTISGLDILRNICIAQQALIYFICGKSTERSSKRDLSEKAIIAFSQIIGEMVCSIEKGKRVQAFYDAMDTMSGKI